MKKVLVGVLVIVALLVAGGLFAFFSSGTERKLATQFVADISSGNTSKAYGLFSPELKKVQSQDAFETQIKTLNLDSGCKLNVSGVQAGASTGSGSQTTVNGKVNCADKSYDIAEFIFDGNDQLYGYSIH
jgi:hypothetical protein